MNFDAACLCEYAQESVMEASGIRLGKTGEGNTSPVLLRSFSLSSAPAPAPDDAGGCALIDSLTLQNMHMTGSHKAMWRNTTIPSSGVSRVTASLGEAARLRRHDVQVCSMRKTSNLSGDCVLPAAFLPVAVLFFMYASSSMGAEVVQPIQQPLGPPPRVRLAAV